MTDPGLHLHQQASEYTDQHNDWVKVAEWFKDKIESWLERDHLEVAFVESRAKSVHSFTKKVLDSGAGTSLGDLADLAAFRVVTYFDDDKQRVIDCLKNAIVQGESRRCREDRVPDRVEGLLPWEFAYRSRHIKFQLHDDLLASSGMPDTVTNEFVEVQVRTITEHVWAAVDHKLRYKAAVDLDDKSLRKLYRVAAQLESIDENLNQLNRTVLKAMKPKGVKVSQGKLEGVKLTKTTVRALLATNAELALAVHLVADHGWTILGSIAEKPLGGVGADPGAPTTQDVACHDLAKLAKTSGIKDVKALDEEARDCLNDQPLLKALTDQMHDHGLPTSAYAADLVAVLILTARGGDITAPYKDWAAAIHAARATYGATTDNPADAAGPNGAHSDPGGAASV